MRRPASTAQLELPLAAAPAPDFVAPRVAARPAHACPACGWFREGFAPCPACGDGPVLRLPPRRPARPVPP